MRLPSSLISNTIIRIPLDVFDRPPHEIHRTFLRIWHYNRGRERVVSQYECDRATQAPTET